MEVNRDAQGGDRYNQPINGIRCSVKSCHYNSGNEECTAGVIHVGPHAMYRTTDAVCATFNPNRERTQMMMW